MKFLKIVFLVTWSYSLLGMENNPKSIDRERIIKPRFCQARHRSLGQSNSETSLRCYRCGKKLLFQDSMKLFKNLEGANILCSKCDKELNKAKIK